MKLDHILVPIDFSEHSELALRTADDLAMLAGQTRLTILHVHQIGQLAVMEFTYVEPAEKVAAAVLEAEKQLGVMAAKLRTPEARRTLRVETGRPLGVILDWSEKVDLIVMPTHGRTGPSHFLLGSVAERVVQAARCSVMVVKRG